MDRDQARRGLGILSLFLAVLGIASEPVEPATDPAPPQPPEPVDPEPSEEPPERHVAAALAWDEHLMKNRERMDRADLVAADKAMDRGDLPPGHFYDTKGRLISPDCVVEHEVLPEARAYADAQGISDRAYEERMANSRPFYVRRLDVVTKDGGPVTVDFSPPVRVRLRPTPWQDLVYVAYGMMAPSWHVTLLERHPAMAELELERGRPVVFQAMEIRVV